MPKFTIDADIEVYLEVEIEAENEAQAKAILKNTVIMNAAFPMSVDPKTNIIEECIRQVTIEDINLVTENSSR